MHISGAALKNSQGDVALTPLRVKGLYVSFYGIGSKLVREPVLALAASRKLNTLVIDVKGDRGMIPYRSDVPLASQIGANKIITVRDAHALIEDLHSRGLYLIARIVTFKDNPLAEAHPELAIRNPQGTLWRDKEGLAWVDASKKEAWNYPIDIAVEAAKNGFDEIQFDYVRFPDAVGVAYSVPNTAENRVNSLIGFFTEARRRLSAYPVFIAADIFGYTAWNLNDTGIGQQIEKIGPLLDYICPMLYPSGFRFGIPGFRSPTENPYETVRLSLERAIARTKLPSNRFRPWLQAFRDYAFDKRVFGATEIGSQIKAADDAGAGGWMLWNPRNVYSADSLP